MVTKRNFTKKIISMFVVALLVMTSFGVMASGATYRAYMNSVDTDKITDNSAYIKGYFDKPSTGSYGDVKFQYDTSSSFSNYSTVFPSIGSDYSAEAKINNLISNTTYYVRLLATINNEAVQSDYVQFTTKKNGSIPTLETLSATLKEQKLYLIGKLDSTAGVYERGFVYSTTVNNPTINDEKVIAETSGAEFSQSFEINPVEKVYYVRAYAMSDATSTKYTGYGKTIKVDIEKMKPTIKTVGSTNVTKNSADVDIDVTREGDVTIIERGVIYSATEKVPEYKAKNTTYVTVFGTLGKGTAKLTNLEAEKTYYARAYAYNSSSISYGEVVEFTTTQGNIEVTVNLLKTDGTILTTQKVVTTPLKSLNLADISIPAGYKAQNPNWDYLVGNNTSTVTLVVLSNESEIMSGIGGNMFAPERGATRAEVAQLLYNLAPDKTYSVTKTYPDVPSNFSTVTASKEAIDFVTERKYMGGYANGNFGPNDILTRAQIATVLANFYGLRGEVTKTFPDTVGHWGEKFISLVSFQKMLNGYPNGNFGPDDITTRAQLAQIFVNSEKRTGNALGSEKFSDVPMNHWAYRAIMNSSIPK